jgi:hypothetical protein
MRTRIGIRLAIPLYLVSLGAPSHALATDKVMIGATEEVLLLSWGMRVRARVDTGASTSSLDARDVRISGRRGARVVRFRLIGDTGTAVVEMPVADVHTVRTPDAKRPERRPTIELDMCVAGHRFSAEVTLNDRSHMKYRMLLGRNALAGRFVVDLKQTGSPPAVCPGGP